VIDWGVGIRVFLLGFSAVFVTLGVLVVALYLLGVVGRGLASKESKNQG
jgi:Na+-transporting methylmalonyl-CoA/oxaloacetate decarboxylase gamma subunit